MRASEERPPLRDMKWGAAAGRSDLLHALEKWPNRAAQHLTPPTQTFLTGTVSRPIFDSHEVRRWREVVGSGEGGAGVIFT